MGSARNINTGGLQQNATTATPIAAIDFTPELRGGNSA